MREEEWIETTRCIPRMTSLESEGLLLRTIRIKKQDDLSGGPLTVLIIPICGSFHFLTLCAWGNAYHPGRWMRKELVGNSICLPPKVEHGIVSIHSSMNLSPVHPHRMFTRSLNIETPSCAQSLLRLHRRREN